MRWMLGLLGSIVSFFVTVMVIGMTGLVIFSFAFNDGRPPTGHPMTQIIIMAAIGFAIYVAVAVWRRITLDKTQPERAFSKSASAG